MFNEHYRKFMSLFWSRDTVYGCPPGLEITTRPPSEYCWKLIPAINAVKLLVNLAPGVIIRIHLRLLQLENCKIEFGTKSKQILGDCFFFFLQQCFLALNPWLWGKKHSPNLPKSCSAKRLVQLVTLAWLLLAGPDDWSLEDRDKLTNSAFTHCSPQPAFLLSHMCRSHRSHQNISLGRRQVVSFYCVFSGALTPPSTCCRQNLLQPRHLHAFNIHCQNTRKSIAAGE